MPSLWISYPISVLASPVPSADHPIYPCALQFITHLILKDMFPSTSYFISKHAVSQTHNVEQTETFYIKCIVKKMVYDSLKSKFQVLKNIY